MAMTFKFFKANHTTSIEECKRQFKRLMVKYHPDLASKRGMSVEEATEACQQIGREWDYLKSHNYYIHEDSNGGTYTDDDQMKADDVTERYADIIEALIKMEGVIVEICGTFLWLSGNTYEHKAEIKALGFRWASKKKRWFLAPKDWKKKGRRELGMDEIRNNYGSVKVAAGSYQPMALGA